MNAEPNPAPTPRTDDGPNPEMVISDQRFQIGFLQRELTSAQAALAAKDAEIARLNGVERELTLTLREANNENTELLKERDALRAEVERLKAHEGDLVIGAAILNGARQQEAESVDQLRSALAAKDAESQRNREAAVKWSSDFYHMMKERDQLRAEVERLADLHVINGTHKANLNDVITQLRAEIARLKVAQRERTQWKCACGGTDCDGQEENKLLRTEVERLKDFELNYETLTRLLHNRFKMKDGIMPDYKVEDVLVENIQLRADKKRLDWLDKLFEDYDEWIAFICASPETLDLRSAIDAARKTKL